MEKRGNSYRIQKMFNGKRYSVTFDHKPKEQEIIKAFADVTEKTHYGKKTFKEAAIYYVDSNNNVYSPSTVCEYKRKIGRLPTWFRDKLVCDITQDDVKRLINDMSRTKSPKTVRDMHGFISPVLKANNPKLVLNTNLPQKEEPDVYIPTDDELRALVEYSKTASNGMFYVPICLGIRSLRRSEICALTIDDLDDNNILTIRKGYVKGEEEWVTKTTKTEKSTRRIPIPQEVADVIREQGYVYNGYPGSISNFIARYCEKFDVPHFSLHKLRHYFASRMLSEKVDFLTVQKIGGWKSDYVVKHIYAHAIDSKVNEALNNLDNILS